MPIPDDGAVVCSFYLFEDAISVSLSRVDGRKLIGKYFWTRASASKELRKLRGKLKRAPKSKRGKLNRDIRSLRKAITQITYCETEPGGSGDSRVRFDDVRAILETNCMSCHRAPDRGWQNSEAFYIGTGRVVPGDLAASSLYTSLAGNPQQFLPGNMPKNLPPLSSASIMVLAQWIEDLGRSEDPGPTPTPTPDPISAEARQAYTTNCSGCHGPLAGSSKLGRSELQIRAAIRSIAEMQHLSSLSTAQIRLITEALGGQIAPPEGSLSIRNVSPVVEGGVGQSSTMFFEVILQGPTSEPFAVDFMTASGTALAGSDFEFRLGTLEFLGTPGERKTIAVQVHGDSVLESNETLYVDLGTPSLAGVGVTVQSAEGRILNDDTAYTPLLPVRSDRLRLAYGYEGSFEDIVGYSHATNVDGVQISSQARIGVGSAEFGLDNDHLRIPGAQLASMRDFTFATWLYWEGNTSQSSRIFDFGNGAGHIFFSPRDVSNRCRFEIRSGGTPQALLCPTGTVIPNNEWTFIAVTFNTTANTMEIYLTQNNVPVRVALLSNVTREIRDIDFSENLIGRSRLRGDSVTDGSFNFPGRLDQTLLWDASLTQSELAQVMAMTQTPRLSPNISVTVDGQPVVNGGIVTMGEAEVGESRFKTLTIGNLGGSRLALQGQPVITMAGLNGSDFSALSWQTVLAPTSTAIFALGFTPNEDGDREAVVVISNSDYSTGDFSFIVRGEGTGEGSGGGSAGGGMDPELVAARALYALNCSACHGGVDTSTKRGSDAARITNALATIPQMSGLQISPQDVLAIAMALNSSVPEDPGSQTAENTTLVVGSAPYAASVLREIFLPPGRPALGDDTTIANVINSRILGIDANGNQIANVNRPLFFGGLCESRFENIPGQRSTCHLERRTVGHNVGPNAIRTGVVIAACNEILSTGTARQAATNALAKLGLVPTDQVTPARVQQLYELFNPGKQLPGYLADVLGGYATHGPGDMPSDLWIAILSIFCDSGHYEVF